MKGNYTSEEAAKAALLESIDHDGALVVMFDDGSYDFYLSGQPVSNYNASYDSGQYRIYKRNEYAVTAIWRGAWMQQLTIPFPE